MIIVPPTTGAATAQADNQGYAQVLKTTRFDGPTFMANLAAQEEAKRKREYEEGLERKRRNAGFLQKLPIVKDFTPYIEADLQKELEAAEQGLAEISMEKGIDLTTDPRGYAVVRDYTNKINRLQTYGREVQDAVDKYAGQITANPGKYESEDFEKWLEAISKIEGVEAKREYALNNPPWKERFDQVDFLKKIPMQKTIIEEGVTTTKQLNYEDVLQSVRFGIEQMALTPDGDAIVQDYYNKGVEEKLWTSPDEMYKSLADEKMRRGGVSITTDEPARSMTITYSGSGTGGTKKNQLSVVHEPQFGGDPTKANAIVWTTDVGDVRPLEMIGENGASVMIKPGRAIRINPDGTLSLTGKKTKRINADEIKRQAAAAGDPIEEFQKKLLAQYGENASVEEDGSVTIVEGKDVTVDVSPGGANYRTIQNLAGGTDIQKLIRDWEAAQKKAGKASAKPASGGSKTNVSTFFSTNK